MHCCRNVQTLNILRDSNHFFKLTVAPSVAAAVWVHTMSKLCELCCTTACSSRYECLTEDCSECIHYLTNEAVN